VITTEENRSRKLIPPRAGERTLAIFYSGDSRSERWRADREYADEGGFRERIRALRANVASKSLGRHKKLLVYRAKEREAGRGREGGRRMVARAYARARGVHAVLSPLTFLPALSRLSFTAPP